MIGPRVAKRQGKVDDEGGQRASAGASRRSRRGARRPREGAPRASDHPGAGAPCRPRSLWARSVRPAAREGPPGVRPARSRWPAGARRPKRQAARRHQVAWTTKSRPQRRPLQCRGVGAGGAPDSQSATGGSPPGVRAPVRCPAAGTSPPLRQPVQSRHWPARSLRPAGLSTSVLCGYPLLGSSLPYQGGAWPSHSVGYW